MTEMTIYIIAAGLSAGLALVCWQSWLLLAAARDLKDIAVMMQPKRAEISITPPDISPILKNHEDTMRFLSEWARKKAAVQKAVDDTLRGLE